MSEDLISREKAYEVLTEYYHHKHISQHIALREALDRVPSAEPERKKGQWQEDPSGYGFWICSNCGFVSEASGANILYSFCPHCGAEMKGEADG